MHTGPFEKPWTRKWNNIARWMINSKISEWRWIYNFPTNHHLVHKLWRFPLPLYYTLYYNQELWHPTLPASTFLNTHSFTSYRLFLQSFSFKTYSNCINMLSILPNLLRNYHRSLLTCIISRRNWLISFGLIISYYLYTCYQVVCIF